MEARQYDWLRRAIRTFAQGFLGVFIFLGLPILTNVAGGDTTLDLNAWKSIGIASSAGGIIALVTAVHNLLEEKTAFPALLKGKASSGANPMPDPGP